MLIKDASPAKLKIIKRRLTYDNPKYIQAKKNGRFIDPVKTPEQLHFYRKRGSSIIVPRGMCGTVCRILGVSHSIVTDFTVAPPIDIAFIGKLRPYQDKAVKDMLKHRYGMLEAATGAGKTVIGTALAAERKVKTLIIVHNKELLDQWVEAFGKFTGISEDSIGIIAGGKCTLKDITVGIINTVQKKASEIKKEFGFVIYDEAHRTVGTTWVRTINTLQPKFHVGLSATPYRSDKLTEALFHIVGPILHKVDRKHLEQTGAILVPKIVRKNTKFFYKFRNDYAAMLSALTQNNARNIQIGLSIIEDFKRNKEPIMVVSDRVTHCEVLRYLIDEEAGIRAVVLSGRLSKEYRKQAIQDLRDGYYDVLVATVSLLGEGFDAPALNAVFLTTPIKFAGRTLQTIGRILRPSKTGVKPRVYDFRDVLIPTLRNSGFARDAVYRKHKWK